MKTIDTILHTIAAEENTTDEAVRAEIQSYLRAAQEQDQELREALTALQPENQAVEDLIIALLAASLCTPHKGDVVLSVPHDT